MTIWLDKAYIKNGILKDVECDSIRIVSENDGRATVVAEVKGSLEVDEMDLGNWKRSLGSIKTGDPTLRISGHPSGLQVEIEVDKGVFSQDVEFEER